MRSHAVKDPKLDLATNVLQFFSRRRCTEDHEDGTSWVASWRHATVRALSNMASTCVVNYSLVVFLKAE